MFWLVIVNYLNIVNYSYDMHFQYHSIKITEYWEQYQCQADGCESAVHIQTTL